VTGRLDPRATVRYSAAEELMSAVIIVLVVVALAGGAFFVARSSKTPAVPQTPAPVVGPKRHFLVGVGGDAEGKSWHVGNRRVTVGRAPSNYIQINAPDVSRMAAQIDAHGDVVKVADMKSRAGTQVNGENVQTAELNDGDELTIGGQTFRYTIEGDFKKNAAFGAKAVGTAVSATTTDARANLELRA
jgi:hypothetical protein